MEQEKTLGEINYLKLATAFLFVQAAGGLCSGKKNSVSPAKAVEATPVCEIAQDEMMVIHGCYKGEVLSLLSPICEREG